MSLGKKTMQFPWCRWDSTNEKHLEYPGCFKMTAYSEGKSPCNWAKQSQIQLEEFLPPFSTGCFSGNTCLWRIHHQVVKHEQGFQNKDRFLGGCVRCRFSNVPDWSQDLNGFCFLGFICNGKEGSWNEEAGLGGLWSLPWRVSMELTKHGRFLTTCE